MFTIKNLMPGDITVSNKYLAKGGKRTVTFVTDAMLAAEAKGYISISPLFGPSNKTLLKPISAAASDFTLVDVGTSYSQYILNTNFSTIANECERLLSKGASTFSTGVPANAWRKADGTPWRKSDGSYWLKAV